MVARAGRRRALVVATAMVGTALFLALAALGFGGWSALLAHPARQGFVALSVALTAVGLLSPVNLSSGEREDAANRSIFAPAIIGVLLLAWLGPWLDRRDLWAVDGDGVRYLGLALFALGGVLRIWPMFVLGERFSGLVAIQPGHELATTGPYRYVRHPSYLGMLIGLAGWALIFRGAVVLPLMALGLPLLAARIDAEEALLASHFGEPYAEYRRRSWRLLPGVY